MTDKKTILFADDNKTLRELMERFAPILFSDYNVEIYSDGTSLEERLKKGSNGVCAVITDNEMPGINGSEIIEKYSHREEFIEVPFILAYGGEEYIGQKTVGKGAAAYIIKPCTPPDLKKLIDEII